MKFLLSLFLSLLYNFSYTQSLMTPREAFFYGMREYNISPGDKLSFNGGMGSSGATYQYGDLYASYFDNNNYIKAVNDEFKRVSYLTKVFEEIRKGINSVDFSKTFYLNTQIEVGIYNTNCSCFPIDVHEFKFSMTMLDIKKVGNSTLWFKNSFATVSVGNFTNLNDFDFSLKMKSSEAENFIDSRKNNSGNINRKINVKIIYSIVDLNRHISAHDDRDYNLPTNIINLEFYDGTHLLGSLYSDVRKQSENIVKMNNNNIQKAEPLVKDCETSNSGEYSFTNKTDRPLYVFLRYGIDNKKLKVEPLQSRLVTDLRFSEYRLDYSYYDISNINVANVSTTINVVKCESLSLELNLPVSAKYIITPNHWTEIDVPIGGGYVIIGPEFLIRLSQNDRAHNMKTFAYIPRENPGQIRKIFLQSVSKDNTEIFLEKQQKRNN
ncbi:MAG: DUF4852 domain-containing protein [Chitinophagaceae bacterium]|nr:DUF4852 domain-containing protein [Chitinophagaceae bacterium]